MTERKILFINLTEKRTEEETIKGYFGDEIPGGVCVAWRIIYDKLQKNVDPFSPENPVIISAGSLVGTPTPGAPKIAGTSKFPTIADGGKHFVGSSVGGGRDFGVMLKNAGYEHLVIYGKADSPVYIIVDNDRIEISSAEDLWGQDIEETTKLLKRRHGSEWGCVAIGKAGENLVRYAMAVVDMTNSLGRSGLGAVMGSKNLKAIVTRGNKGIEIKNVEQYRNALEKMMEEIWGWENLEKWLGLGMGAGWSTFKYTQYPGKWTRDKWDQLYGEAKRKETLDKVVGCASCRISCRIKWRLKSGEFAGEVGMGSPYGKSATSGQLLDVEDHRKMLHMVTIANRAGLDFYTFTRMTDWMTTLAERGEIPGTSEELGRDYDNYLQLLDKVVNREGIGKLMADGWNAVKDEYGVDPQDYWYGGICKGVDFIYDARVAKFHPLMMTFFTNPRPHHGGTHTVTTQVGRAPEEIKEQLKTWGLPDDTLNRIFTPTQHSGKFNVGRYTKWMEDAMAVRNSLGLCSIYSFFGLENLSWIAQAYSAVLGKEYSAYELMEEGEKAFNCKKLINVREGFERKDDRVPELWLRPMETPEGKEETMDYYKEKVMSRDDFAKVLDDYYDERGWDVETGIPTKEKINKLGLRWEPNE